MSEASSLEATPTRRSRGWGWLVVGFAALVVAVALITTGIGALSSGARAGDGLRDMNGNPVQFDAGETPAPQPAQTADATTNGRFAVPLVGLDVPLGVMSVVGGEVVPPTFDSAFWVSGLGVSPDQAASGTLFVAMHALRNGAVGPGNSLIDIDAARSRLEVGTKVSVGALRYEVTGSAVIPRDEIAARAEVWADEPGRLVIITCLQRPDNHPAVANVVITARLVADDQTGATDGR